jgi:hypothetical protein
MNNKYLTGLNGFSGARKPLKAGPETFYRAGRNLVVQNGGRMKVVEFRIKSGWSVHLHFFKNE